jgi:hypothetical protein
MMAGIAPGRRLSTKAVRDEGRALVWYWTGGLLGLLWIVLLITLGVMTLRKGHWVMFIVGIFLPLFWIIGAVIPSKHPETAAI